MGAELSKELGHFASQQQRIQEMNQRIAALQDEYSKARPGAASDLAFIKDTAAVMETVDPESLPGHNLHLQLFALFVWTVQRIASAQASAKALVASDQFRVLARLSARTAQEMVRQIILLEEWMEESLKLARERINETVEAGSTTMPGSGGVAPVAPRKRPTRRSGSARRMRSTSRS
eukprot:NODE_5428_length_677_cov_26.904459_g5053_i0.p1 GENE.NODE_5428_length_677_cov_26.904459_g5053_i0~~NODE_5428_length_677_cov_26.904459_g5053_i0.p1  ORF type:complete len:177 (+),score=37.63 NODE_5428_length_677_cov_26.904459_g5053_i0:31-561(+)